MGREGRKLRALAYITAHAEARDAIVVAASFSALIIRKFMKCASAKWGAQGARARDTSATSGHPDGGRVHPVGMGARDTPGARVL